MNHIIKQHAPFLLIIVLLAVGLVYFAVFRAPAQEAIFLVGEGEALPEFCVPPGTDPVPAGKQICAREAPGIIFDAQVSGGSFEGSPAGAIPFVGDDPDNNVESDLDNFSWDNTASQLNVNNLNIAGTCTGCGGGGGWSLSGNSGTTTADFLGTLDNVPLIFKVNNLQAGRIEPSLGDIDGSNNLFLGREAGSTNLGYNNVGIGAGSLSSLVSVIPNEESVNNTAIGFSSLLSNTGGNNVAIGSGAGISNTTGNVNVFIGNGAGQGFSGTADGKLYIRNSPDNPHLITGDFPTDAPGSYGTVSIMSVLNLVPMANAPTSPSDGDVYMDADGGLDAVAAPGPILCYWDGAGWLPLTGNVGTGCI